MPQDFLQMTAAFNRDFADLESMADRIAKRANPADPNSADEEAARLIHTRCAQGGTTMLFQPSKSASDRERLVYGLVYLVRRKIEGKRGRPGA